MHLPIMWMMLSDAPGSLHKSQLNSLAGLFVGENYPFPALLFFKPGVPDNVELFRSILGKLCDTAEMKSAYKEIESARKRVTEKDGRKDLITAITAFWDAHGEVLHKKLVMSEDSTILYNAEHDPEKKKDGEWKAYVKHMADHTEAKTFNQKTLADNFYSYDKGASSSWVWNTENFLNGRNVKIDNSS